MSEIHFLTRWRTTNVSQPRNLCSLSQKLTLVNSPSPPVLSIRPQHRCRRCDGCQHRSPRSAQDRTHPRWPGSWSPRGCQGTRQVRFKSLTWFYFFSNLACFVPYVSLMIFWLPLLSSVRKTAIVTQYLSEMHAFGSVQV